MTYSSILPAIANEIPKPGDLVHGAVLESILSVHTVERGQRAAVGVIYGWLNSKNTGKKHGGLVCELSGDFSPAELETKLNLSLDELYYNGFSDDFSITSRHIVIESVVPTKKYGTALAGLCFVNYVVPVLG